MAKKLSFRKGDKVRLLWRHLNMWGACIGTTEEVVTVIGRVRDEYGRFCCPDDRHAYVKVLDANGTEREVNTSDCEVYNTMYDLTHDELRELRGQVVLGSCYLSDYENNFGIDKNQVYDFCEAFGASIDWDDEQDTPENFADYCEGAAYNEAA